jgi:hypothetical protein
MFDISAKAPRTHPSVKLQGTLTRLDLPELILGRFGATLAVCGLLVHGMTPSMLAQVVTGAGVIMLLALVVNRLVYCWIKPRPCRQLCSPSARKPRPRVVLRRPTGGETGAVD